MQLPQIKVLALIGTFIRYTLDGIQRPSSVPRVRSTLHITNFGASNASFTVRMLNSGVKVGGSSVVTVKPEETVTVDLDNWYDQIEVLSDVKVQVMIRGVSSHQFGASINPGEARSGFVDTEVQPFDYPSVPPA